MAAHEFAFHNRLQDLIAEQIKGDVIHQENENSSIPLHTAAFAGHLNVCQWLFEQDHTTAARQNMNGMIPLHFAARNGHVEVVKFLVSSAPEIINTKDDAGFTPLHYATREQHNDVVAILMAAGANVNERNIVGKLPADYARNADVKALFSKKGLS